MEARSWKVLRLEQRFCKRGCSQLTTHTRATGRPKTYDLEEPQWVAKALQRMGIQHAVITSVNRDELPDRGAEIWYQTVRAIKDLCPHTTVETIIPDVK
eukprot:2242707-Lingulodinium_polyedra.AAC.1